MVPSDIARPILAHGSDRSSQTLRRDPKSALLAAGRRSGLPPATTC